MATETTDSAAKIEQALAKVDETAARLRAVATRLLAEHVDSLPPLLGVYFDACSSGPSFSLQPSTAADAAVWAKALGVTLTASKGETFEGGYFARAVATFEVDGVRIRLASSEMVFTSGSGAVAA